MPRFQTSMFFAGAFSSLLLTFPNVAKAAVLWDTLTPLSSVAVSSQLDVPDESADDFTVTGNGFEVTDVSFLALFRKVSEMSCKKLDKKLVKSLAFHHIN